MKNPLAKLTFVMFAAIGTLAYAQTQDTMQAHHQVNPQQQVNHLTKKLALTADQQNQLLPILTDRQQQATAIRNDSSLSKEQRREKMQALRSDSESKIRAILTDTQRNTYDQMLQEARDHAHTRKQTTVQQ